MGEEDLGTEALAHKGGRGKAQTRKVSGQEGLLAPASIAFRASVGKPPSGPVNVPNHESRIADRESRITND